MYKKLLQTNAIDGSTTEHILLPREDGSVVSFPNVESNDGPERQAYLAWVAEGNEAEEWSAE
jgi:hypothetical protein